MPTRCPDLSAERLCYHFLALNFHGDSVVLAASSHGGKLKGFWEEQQKGTGCPSWNNLSGLRPLPCHLLRSIQGREGARSRLCELLVPPQTLAQLLQLACVRWSRRPKADLTLLELSDLPYVNRPCLGASTFLHTWTLSRALCAEQAQPHNPEVRELKPGLLYPEYSNQ